MRSTRVPAIGGLWPLALSALAVAWAANVEAMPAAHALLSQSAYASYQDEEEEVEDSGAEEYTDEAEYADDAEYAEETEPVDEAEYADETEGSGEYADSGETEDAVAEEVEWASDENREAGAGFDQARYVDDYDDDSWAPDLVESEADDAIPIDDESRGGDLIWEVVEVEEFVPKGKLGDAEDESDEDSVAPGELMVVTSRARSRSSLPGSGTPGAKAPGSWPTGSRAPGSKPPGSKSPGLRQSYGGRPVSALSVPWQAEIYNPRLRPAAAGGKPAWQREHYCGGALIARDWVLTAAHCIDQRMVDLGFKVRLGMTDLSKGDGQSYRIDRIVRHSQYNADNNDPAKPPNMYANDIALIRIVDDGAPKPRDPKRIREIPLNRMPLQPGVPVSVTGWGVTGTGAADAASAVILRVDLQLMDTEVCSARPKFGPQKIHGKVFCAADPQRSTCRGDSGGPVVLANAAPVLVGVVSWGKKQCAGDGRPGVYTRVDRYLDWIDKAMKLPPGRNSLP